MVELLIPLLKGVGDIGGSVGYGLEKAGATKLGQGLQQSNESLQTTLTARQSQQAQEDAKKTLIDDNGNFNKTDSDKIRLIYDHF